MTSNEYATYEYAQVEVPVEKEPLYRDTYRNLGWIVEPNMSRSEFPAVPGVHASTKTLRVKRDRRLPHLAQINPLQASCQNALATIEDLERSVKTSPMITAFTIGLIGMVFLAVAVFAISGYLSLGGLGLIAASVLGVVCWVLPYPVFKHMTQQRARAVSAPIAQQYDILYDASEKAATLLRG